MDHIQEHRSLLASAGKRLLVSIARRLPLWPTSDHLTLIGPTELWILIAAGGFYVAAHPWVEITSAPRPLVGRQRVRAVAGLTLVFVASAMRNTRTLYLAEPCQDAVLMTLFAGVPGLPPLPANVLAVAVMSSANFVMADRWVFRAAPLAVACVLLAPGAAAALAAWERYVAATEPRLDRAPLSRRPRHGAWDAISAGVRVELESLTSSRDVPSDASSTQRTPPQPATTVSRIGAAAIGVPCERTTS